MSNYQTPGVYVEEISTLAPSVAAVSTAIPAFIGLTEKAEDTKGESLTLVPTRIKSLDKYETLFGKGKKESFTINVTDTKNEGNLEHRDISVTPPDPPKYFMYESMQLYFANGGGPCYVISTGKHDVTASNLYAELKKGLDTLEAEDEPTLIVFPDAYELSDLTIYNDALAQCNKLQDRFAIMDVKTNVDDLSKDALTFRGKVTSSYLQYGAAYYPDVKTNLTHSYDETSQIITYKVNDSESSPTLSSLKENNRTLYDAVVEKIATFTMTVPPSGAVAGVYAQTDRDRGVWKAPANIALNNVAAPAVKITDATQASLNIDADSGKSINAIRSFTGKGTLVWGARTLDGNSNEWRYIQVRRLFNYIEESIKKSTSWAVFEANDANTHIRVKAQIESFLTGIWRAGGLVGASAAQAFFVNVGLGSTMTSQDVLEGRMHVEIGLAASRPAEFIILKFSHFIQQS
jgi:phage tail sheath protein FI